MLWHFKHCNCLVAGFKGTGKDCIFDYVIKKRNDFYYANIDYSVGNSIPREITKLTDVSVAPNTYQNFVNQDTTFIPRRFYDGKDIYISDIGNFLPSSWDQVLHKKYPSMPIFYSLSRHLYGNNVHCNSQNIERGWKAIREQAEFYVVCKKTFKLFGGLITVAYTYTNYESARQRLKPIKVRWLNKQSRAQADLYYAQHGDIRKIVIIQRISKMSYDTRAFEKFIFVAPREYFSKRLFHQCFLQAKFECKNLDISVNPTLNVLDYALDLYHQKELELKSQDSNQLNNDEK